MVTARCITSVTLSYTMILYRSKICIRTITVSSTSWSGWSVMHLQCSTHPPNLLPTVPHYILLTWWRGVQSDPTPRCSRPWHQPSAWPWWPWPVPSPGPVSRSLPEPLPPPWPVPGPRPRPLPDAVADRNLVVIRYISTVSHSAVAQPNAVAGRN